MSILNSIRAMLDRHLAETDGLPVVVGENAKFTQSAETSHVRTKFAATSIRPAVRGPNPQHRYQGLYTISVRIPLESGTGEAFEYADIIRQRFNGSTAIQGAGLNVSIEYSEMGNAIVDDPFYSLPVQVAWYVYAL